MDATYFLRKRTDLIRFFYDKGSAPFTTIMAQIDGDLPPFDDPPWEESGEPAYQLEWSEAQTALDLLARAAVSMLADALKLYLQTLERNVIGFSLPDAVKKRMKKEGYVPVYLEALRFILDADPADAGVRVDVIEQVVLTRNRVQHGGYLPLITVTHDNATLKKHSRPFFANEQEAENASDAADGEGLSFLAPFVEITHDKLMAAVLEVERLAEWVDNRQEAVWAWRAGSRAPWGA